MSGENCLTRLIFSHIMDSIEIKKFPEVASSETLQALSYHLDRECNRINLKEINWPDVYPYKPEVYFRIAYNERHLFLKFDVQEYEFRATALTPCSPVWEDSCVEFFIQPEKCTGYYNIELNAIGTVLGAFGTSREKRRPIPRRLDSDILRDSTIKFNNENPDEAYYQWSLMVKIPYTVFFRHKFQPKPGTTIRGNIHKCGNKLPHPHFVTWHPVKTPKPDFHQPEHFGTLIFK